MKSRLTTALKAGVTLALLTGLLPGAVNAAEYYYESYGCAPVRYYTTSSLDSDLMEVAPTQVIERSSPVIIERPATTVIERSASPVIIEKRSSHHLVHLGVFPLLNFSAL